VYLSNVHLPRISSRRSPCTNIHTILAWNVKRFRVEDSALGIAVAFVSVPVPVTPIAAEGNEEGNVSFSSAVSFFSAPAVALLIIIMPWISQGREVEMLVAPGGSLTT